MAIALVSEQEALFDELAATPWPRPSLTVVSDNAVPTALVPTAHPNRERSGHERPGAGHRPAGVRIDPCPRPVGSRTASTTPQWATHHRAPSPSRVSAPVRRRRLALGAVVAALAVALALPLSALGGHPATSVHDGVRTVGALPVTYVVQSGDTLHSIAERFAAPGAVGQVQARLADELGSGVVVPGEHIQLP